MHNFQGCCGPDIRNIPRFGANIMGYMPYDLEEDEKTYYVTMPLPGYDVKDIQVSVKGNTILIEAEKEENEKSDTEMKKRKKIMNMGGLIWNRPIEVKIPVQDEIDPDKVKAKLKKGLLEVKFTKIPGTSIKIDEE